MNVWKLTVESVDGDDCEPNFLGLYATVELAKQRAQEWMTEDEDEAVGDWEEYNSPTFHRLTLQTKNEEAGWAREYEMIETEVHGS